MSSKRATGKPTGHHSRLHTDKKGVETLIKCVAIGVPIMQACQASGIPYRTYRDWMVLGEKGDQPYAEFFAEIDKAQGLAVATRLNRLQKAAQGGAWQADAWWLERRFPKEFGRRQEITGPDGGPIMVTDTGRDKVVKAIEEMRKRLTDGK